MNVLFVPSLGLDTSLLDRLADSVDFDVKFRIILNNGPEGALEPWGDAHPDWIVKEPATGNLGVAGSWNYCAKIFPDEPCWLLMNEDAYFLSGYLEQICRRADESIDEPVLLLNDSNAFYSFVWTAVGKERFGTFDENFWPAYYEDCDYRVRMKLGGVTSHPYALQGLPPLPHGKPKDGGTDYAAMLQGCGLLNRAYWKRKWGNRNYDHSLYKTPYNDHRVTVKDWVWYPEERAKRHPLWETFMQNPSLYD